MDLYRFAFCLLTAMIVLPRADAAETFSAGAATADITPHTWPVPMVGSFSERLATHAWDPLKARALVLDNGTTRLVSDGRYKTEIMRNGVMVDDHVDGCFRYVPR